MRILLVVYDNESYISWFPQGLAYIASVFKNAGHDVEIYNQDIYHWPEKHLKHLLDEEQFDIIGVSVIAGYYQYRKLLKISSTINNSKNRPFYILGGHGPAPEPEYFLKKTGADVIVIGEGERTALEIIEALENKRSFSSIKGIAYMDHNLCNITPPRPLIQDLDEIPMPAWELFRIEYYSRLRFVNMSNTDLSFPVLSGRGCKFNCNFCYRMDKGHRSRSVESIIEEIRILSKNYNINYIIFSDELLMTSFNRIESICEGILKAKVSIKWTCNGRLNYAIPNVLKLMKKAGCIFINYGIESLDEKALKVMNKKLTVKQIHNGVQNTLEAGISPGLNIIFGNIGENKNSLDKGLEFLLKYDDHAQMRTIRPVTPYPGSPLYYYAIQEGLLKDCEDFYENKHINSDLLAVNFTSLSDDEYYEALYAANKRLIEKYFDNKKQLVLHNAHNLYYNKDKFFRGFRQT